MNITGGCQLSLGKGLNIEEPNLIIVENSLKPYVLHVTQENTI